MMRSLKDNPEINPIYKQFDLACADEDYQKAIACLPLMRDRLLNITCMQVAVCYKQPTILKAMLNLSGLLRDEDAPKTRSRFLLPKNTVYDFQRFVSFAISANDLETMGLLLKVVNIKRENSSALAYAAQKGFGDMVSLLWGASEPLKAIKLLRNENSVTYNPRGAALLEARIKITEDHDFLTKNLQDIKLIKSAVRKM